MHADGEMGQQAFISFLLLGAMSLLYYALLMY